MMAKHILVPTDFSDYANYAVDYALELATTLQARLTFAHIIHLTPLVMGDLGSLGISPYLVEIETDAQQRMQALLDRVQKAGLQGETIVVHGIPFQVIIETAESRDVDLIVMGTHGRTGLTHVLMGSVAEKVVRLAPCPVLVTRGTAETAGAS